MVTFPRDAFVGFDRLFDQLEAGVSAQNSYPPHNIVKTGEDKYAIEIALAGFTIDDIDAEWDGNVLIITGQKKAEEEREYIHKGISARKFQRKFTLAEHVKVTGADMVNGVLAIHLEKQIPEELKPRKIEISSEQLLLG